MTDTEGQIGSRLLDEKKLLFCLMLWMMLFYFVYAGAAVEFERTCVWAFTILTFGVLFMRDIMKPDSNLAKILEGLRKP